MFRKIKNMFVNTNSSVSCKSKNQRSQYLPVIGILTAVLIGICLPVNAEEPEPFSIDDIIGGQDEEWAAENDRINRAKIECSESERLHDSIQTTAGYVYLNVPLYHQESAHNCAPASAQMLLKYITGIKYDQWGLASAMSTSQTGGTYIDNLCTAINSYLAGAGIDLYFSVGDTDTYSIEYAFQYTLNQGYPVIPYVQMYDLPSSSPINAVHAICVKGYNYTYQNTQALNAGGWSRVFYYNDPYIYSSAYYGSRSATCAVMETAVMDVLGQYGFYVW